MTLDDLIHHLTTMRAVIAPGDTEVFMVPDDSGEMIPVESPVMIGNDLCLYSEKLF